MRSTKEQVITKILFVSRLRVIKYLLDFMLSWSEAILSLFVDDDPLADLQCKAKREAHCAVYESKGIKPT